MKTWEIPVTYAMFGHTVSKIVRVEADTLDKAVKMIKWDDTIEWPVDYGVDECSIMVWQVNAKVLEENK